MSAWDALVELTRRFEHRSSTTAHERAAARWLAGRLSSLGYQVREHSFRAPKETLYTGPPLVGAAILLMAWLMEILPHPWGWLALAGALASLVPLMGELLGSGPNLDLILPLRPSQNVEAIRPAEGEARRTVVITAHYDTQRASPLFAPWFGPFVRPFLTLGHAAILGLPVLMFLSLVVPGLAWVRPLMRLFMALLALTMGFLLACKLFARDINGANDNGSGTAVALALAERMAARRPEGLEGSIPVPPDTEVRFLFTGCEEVGVRGMAAWLKGPGRELKPGTVFVNL
ncbi:MAG TPA: M28 family peptidase, partial [Limnochorda sp.]